MATETVTLDIQDLDDSDDTKQAIWFLIDGEEYWVPRSQIYHYDKDTEELEVSEWWAKEHGLI